MEEVEKPVAICDYNEHMFGVDHVNQLISYYPCTRRTLKWTKKVFLRNGTLMLYKAKTGSQSMTLGDFQLALILRLCRTSQDISDDENDDAPPPCSSAGVDAPNRLRGGFKSHILEELPPTAKKQKPQRKCKLCSKKGRCRDTCYCYSGYQVFLINSFYLALLVM